MVNVDEELMSCFLDEATDTLAQWERACLDIESNESAELYNALFRAAHNLKGASRSVGLEDFGAFVHIAEDVINLLIKGEISLYPGLVSILLECQIFLQKWVEGLRADVNFVLHAPELLHRIELLGKRSIKDPSEYNNQATEQALKVVPTLSAQNTSTQAISSALNELDTMFEIAQTQYNDSITNQELEPKIQSTTESASETKAAFCNSTALNQCEQKKAARSDETIRVAASKLDELIQLIGELAVHQSIIHQGRRTGNLHQSSYQNAIQLSTKIIKEAHSKALSLRMQPVHALFQRLERTAKDVARSQSKQIEVILAGTEVELDKTVIERITDPLVHILRNAVDHGIESSVERELNAKTTTAKITISAVQEAGSVCIQISDDGRGINPEKVLKKALEKGLIQHKDSLSTKEMQNLIFLPGFSTAEQITDISGRGVGMDVVLKAVQSLQGTIDLESNYGQGTLMSITLPTSMSIIDGMVIKVNDLRYVISMHELTEIVDLSAFKIESTANLGKMIELRGGVIPLESLNSYLTTSRVAVSRQDTTSSKPAIIVKEGQNLIAFQVDEVVGQQSVVVRPLSQQMSTLAGFSGSTILGDGEPGMILSLMELARHYLHKSHQGAQTL